MNKTITGVRKVKGMEAWIAILDGKEIATFNSPGAAMAGLEVEKRRKIKKELTSVKE